jgi:signal transduction histidine kinase
VLCWAGFGGLVLAEGLTRGDPWWVLGLELVVLAVAVVVRRVRPLVAPGLVGGVVIAQLLAGLGTTDGVAIAAVPALVWLCYVAGRRSGATTAFAVLVVGELLAMLLLGLLLRDVTAAEATLNMFFFSLMALLLVVLPWLFGRYRSQRDLLVSAGWDLAERMEREQRMVADEARLRERSTIAQDMHDSVGHELSLIALRAGSLEVDPGLADRHRRAATELREAAAAATERLGEIIGVLRDPGAEAPVRPAQETVADLVERAAASGLDVSLHAQPVGEPAPMVELAAHRVVQEALTNAAKHAPGAAVTVRLETDGDEVVVRVANGAGTRPGTAGSGGRGLLGLAERVRLAGGTLSSGPTADGRFEVVARLPVTGGPPVAGSETQRPQVVSRSADELERRRRTARRGLVTAVAVPVALAAVMGGVAFGYYAVVGYNSVLDPADYEALRVGQPMEEVERVLPRMERFDPPERVRTPPGATCRYYRTAGPFSSADTFQVCFAGGRLVAKDLITVRLPGDGVTPS